MTAWRVGIDIGGTFTDLAAADLESGQTHELKVPSTPSAPADGAAAALQELAKKVSLRAIAFLAHGTTVGTNALIEGTGACTGLITTEGFRDLLEIARQQRPSLYDLGARKPSPLVPRWLRREVPERLRFDGSVERCLDIDAARRELVALRDEGVEAVAICFLHCYANPSHEHAVCDLARQLLPDAYVTASCDLLPRFREYERLSTTVVNAYLGPLMDRYLNELSALIERSGVRAALHIMQSNGGLASPDEARERPAATVLSGPAAGAAAAADLCGRIEVERAIAIDMGGTSTDVCLIHGGLPAIAPGREIEGYAVEVPGVDVRCIGAGGGSILSIDPGGLPRVGPRSAGADPGPACYGRAGMEPTLTDSFLILGRLDAAGLLSGAMPLDAEAARQAISDTVASALGVSIERAALGAVELCVANVMRAVESMTVAEGRDPRDYALVAAGGAGPVIACELAAAIDIGEIIVPPSPGNFSACGLLASDMRRDWTRTRIMPAAVERLDDMNGEFAEMEAAAREWLAGTAAPGSRPFLLRSVAARYVGQDYELTVPLATGALTAESLAEMLASFHEAHEGRYGYSLPDRPVEIVDLNVTAIQQLPSSQRQSSGRKRMGDPEEPRTREVYLGDREGWALVPVQHRSSLQSGDSVEGPAVIEQYDSTTYLPPRFCARVDQDENLRLTRSEVR